MKKLRFRFIKIEKNLTGHDIIYFSRGKDELIRLPSLNSKHFLLHYKAAFNGAPLPMDPPPSQNESVRDDKGRWVAGCRSPNPLGRAKKSGRPNRLLEKAREHGRRYYAANREKLLQKQRLRCAANPEKVSESARKHKLKKAVAIEMLKYLENLGINIGELT